MLLYYLFIFQVDMYYSKIFGQQPDLLLANLSGHRYHVGNRRALFHIKDCPGVLVVVRIPGLATVVM